jgi:hypothetical protein
MSAELTGNQERAALLMADDAKTDIQIGQECGVTERTIERWRKLPAIVARIAEHRRLQAAALTDEGIANRQNRIDRLNRRARLMDRVIAERAVAKPLQKVPGGKTGLLVRTAKGRHIVFEVDTGLLAELRAHELQAAKETGQWEEKSRVTNEGAPQQVFVYLPENGRDRTPA